MRRGSHRGDDRIVGFSPAKDRASDPVAQMVDMISASRSYQANVEVFNTAKELALATLNMGR